MKIISSKPKPFEFLLTQSKKDVRFIQLKDKRLLNEEGKEDIINTMKDELILKKNYAETYVDKNVPILEGAGIFNEIADFIGYTKSMIDIGSGSSVILDFIEVGVYHGLDNNPFMLYKAFNDFEDSFLHSEFNWDVEEGILKFMPKDVIIPKQYNTYFTLMEQFYEHILNLNGQKTELQKFIKENNLQIDCLLNMFSGSASNFRDNSGIGITEGGMFDIGTYANASLCLDKNGKFVKVIRTHKDFYKEIKKQLDSFGLYVVDSKMIKLPSEPSSEELYIDPSLKHCQMFEIRKK